MKQRERIGIVHVHSDYSHDGRDSLEALRDHSKTKGIHFIALTEHAEDLDERRFTEYSARCFELSDSDVSLIPGLEFRFAGLRGLHLLAMGLRRWIAPATPDEFVVQARPNAQLLMMAHPILTGYQVPPHLLSALDAVEIWNAGYNTRYLPDPHAIRLLRRAREQDRHLVGIAGLDQHDRTNDRGLRVVVSADDAAAPLDLLKAGKFSNRALGFDFSPALEWNAVSMGMLRGARWCLDRADQAHGVVVRLLRRRVGA